MLQKFENTAQPDQAAARLDQLRASLGGLDGFLVPREDEFMGEYVPPCGERLKWLTGFGGSAGVAAVLRDKAALLLDGRYTLEAENHIDTGCLEIVPIAETLLHSWLAENLTAGQSVGYDPRLHSISQIRKLSAELEKKRISLQPVSQNPIDPLWRDRPPPPEGEIRIHPHSHAGKSSQEKRREIAAALKAENHSALLVTQPENIAWLLNIRGSDVPRTPFVLSFALLRDDARLAWFIRPGRLSNELKEHLGEEVDLVPPEEMEACLRGQAETVLLDPVHAPQYFSSILEDRVAEGSDPCNLMKACKNDVEIEGAKAAHMRDGAALCAFLHWLDVTAPKGNVSEIDAVTHLEKCRMATGELQDLSFDTISGSGPNGAIVHYRVQHDSNRLLKPGDLYLVDSGGQYLDGTTDVTRTVLIGGAPPPDNAIHAFTRVLKGHIALATARFPENTDGVALDALARAPLWAAGLDFDHGTGHGVGSYLSVHEGPQRISKGGTQALVPGMIVSNEPGFYEKGAFGIRIENLQYVTPPEEIEHGSRRMLGFEVLTLAPIDKRLIDPGLLTQTEKGWLNAYHRKVCETLSPLVDAETTQWLKKTCGTI